MRKDKNYIGRFAPSPTGPLHFGSIVATVASYLQARSRGGTWLLRIEDMDPPREPPGAADSILRTLERLSLYWDGEVLYQSRRTDAYNEALQQLRNQGMLYPCSCSRKEIAEQSVAGRYGPVYNGLCRQGVQNNTLPLALRVMTHNDPIGFVDRVRGRITQRLESEIGDFVVRRADNLFAYQLAVVVDDAAQGVTEVVRGSDLLDNTPRQIHLQQLLGVSTPSYAHLPLALNASGQKLSKQSGAQSVDLLPPAQLLFDVLDFLGQHPPYELKTAAIDDIWQWAVHQWKLENVPANDQIYLG